MKHQTEAKLAVLLRAIQNQGLVETVAQTVPYQTVCRIVATGTDLQFEGQEFEDDTEDVARVLSDPDNWGVSAPAWQEFAEAWREA